MTHGLTKINRNPFIGADHLGAGTDLTNGLQGLTKEDYAKIRDKWIANEDDPNQ